MHKVACVFYQKPHNANTLCVICDIKTLSICDKHACLRYLLIFMQAHITHPTAYMHVLKNSNFTILPAQHGFISFCFFVVVNFYEIFASSFCGNSKFTCHQVNLLLNFRKLTHSTKLYNSQNKQYSQKCFIKYYMSLLRSNVVYIQLNKRVKSMCIEIDGRVRKKKVEMKCSYFMMPENIVSSFNSNKYSTNSSSFLTSFSL